MVTVRSLEVNWLNIGKFRLTPGQLIGELGVGKGYGHCRSARVT